MWNVIFTYLHASTWTAAKNEIFKGLSFKPTGFLVKYLNDIVEKFKGDICDNLLLVQSIMYILL